MGRQDKEKKERKLSLPSAVDFIGKGVAFAGSLGLSIYLIGVLGGGWLDRCLGTEPVFMFVGILIAIFTSFYYLFRAFFMDMDNENKDTGDDDENPNGSR